MLLFLQNYFFVLNTSKGFGGKAVKRKPEGLERGNPHP
jgi:hypothetical protein